MKLVFESRIDLPLLEIKSRFNQELFLALKPPVIKLTINRFDGCSPGDEIHLDLNTMGNKQQWISVITEEKQDAKEWSFVDEGKVMPWPLATWKHHHRVVSLGDKSAMIIDDITFGCAHFWMEKLIYPALWFTFAIRPARYRKFFLGV